MLDCYAVSILLDGSESGTVSLKMERRNRVSRNVVLQNTENSTAGARQQRGSLTEKNGNRENTSTQNQEKIAGIY